MKRRRNSGRGRRGDADRQAADGRVTWADVTVDDAISTKPQDVVGVTLNGKRFMAYDSTQDRLHVYDPNLASPRVRRVGLATPAAPTAADTGGAGAYAAVQRWYRVRWLQWTGGVVIRRSEPSTSTSFHAIGRGSGADHATGRPRRRRDALGN
jgi:hypothetical protein